MVSVQIYSGIGDNNFHYRWKHILIWVENYFHIDKICILKSHNLFL
jgi:hypothetical protein